MGGGGAQWKRERERVVGVWYSPHCRNGTGHWHDSGSYVKDEWCLKKPVIMRNSLHSLWFFIILLADLQLHSP